MLKFTLAALVAGLSLQAGAYPHRFPAYEPQYIFDGQYTAQLQQHRQHWRLLPLRGAAIDVAQDDAKCSGTRIAMPNGLWFVTQDGDGKPQLEAPSVTVLPQGFPARIALRGCGDQADAHSTLFVPERALSWIEQNAGTVLIDE